ncbi:MAG: hypothetical protein K2R98_26060 [Gemmataceae bacterium]|nr:hypothetical protein [Gemmataceae bacterium]
MKRTALMLAALTCLVGAMNGRAQEVVSTEAPSAVVVTSEPAACSSPDCGASCGVSCGDDCGGRKHKIFAWLCHCPNKTKSPCNCCHSCACCCGPLYGFFLCQCYPQAHVGDGRYIGQGQPPAPPHQCGLPCGCGR